MYRTDAEAEHYYSYEGAIAGLTPSLVGYNSDLVWGFEEINGYKAAVFSFSFLNIDQTVYTHGFYCLVGRHMYSATYMSAEENARTVFDAFIRTVQFDAPAEEGWSEYSVGGISYTVPSEYAYTIDEAWPTSYFHTAGNPQTDGTDAFLVLNVQWASLNSYYRNDEEAAKQFSPALWAGSAASSSVGFYERTGHELLEIDGHEAGRVSYTIEYEDGTLFPGCVIVFAVNRDMYSIGCVGVDVDFEPTLAVLLSTMRVGEVDPAVREAAPHLSSIEGPLTPYYAVLEKYSFLPAFLELVDEYSTNPIRYLMHFDEVWGNLVMDAGGIVYEPLLPVQRKLVNFEPTFEDYMFYVPETGVNYHSDSWCYMLLRTPLASRGMDRFSDVVEMGLTPCSKCVPDEFYYLP